MECPKEWNFGSEPDPATNKNLMPFLVNHAAKVGPPKLESATTPIVPERVVLDLANLFTIVLAALMGVDRSFSSCKTKSVM